MYTTMKELVKGENRKQKHSSKSQKYHDTIIQAIRSLELLEKTENDVDALTAILAKNTINMGYKSDTCMQVSTFVAPAIGDVFFKQIYEAKELEDKMHILISAVKSVEYAINTNLYGTKRSLSKRRSRHEKNIRKQLKKINAPESLFDISDEEHESFKNKLDNFKF